MVAGTIGTDPEIQRELGLQSQFAGQQGLEDITPESLAANYINNLSNVYATQKRDIKTFYDPAYKAKVTAADKKKQDFTASLSAPIPMFKPGTGIENQSQLLEAKTSADMKILTAKDNFDAFVKANGITQNADGTYNYRVIDNTTGIATDFSDEAAIFKLQIENANKEKAAFAKLEAESRKEAGFTPEYENSYDYQKLLNDSREEVEKEFIFKLNTRQGFDGLTNEDWKEKRLHQIMMDKDPREKKYAEILKAKSEAGTFAAGVTRVDKELQKSLEDTFMAIYPNFEMAKGSVKDIRTGMELTEDDFDDVAITDKARPTLIGYYLDDAEEGKLKLVYNLKTVDDKGNETGVGKTVKIDAFENLAPILASQGKFSEAKAVINSQLVNKFGALGELTQEDTLVYGEGDNALRIKVTDKDSDPNQMYTASLPMTDEKGNTINKPLKFGDKATMVNYLSNIIAIYYQKQLNQTTENAK